MSFNWDLADVFLKMTLEFWVWGRKATEVRCHSHQFLSSVHTINMTSHCWYWPWSPGWVVRQVSPLWSDFPSPCFCTILMGGRPYVQSVCNGVGKSNLSTQIIWNPFVWEGCLVPSHIYLFTSVLIHGYLLWVISQDCFILFLRLV